MNQYWGLYLLLVRPERCWLFSEEQLQLFLADCSPLLLGLLYLMTMMLNRRKHILGFISLPAVLAPLRYIKLRKKRRFMTNLTIVNQCLSSDTHCFGQLHRSYLLFVGPYGSGTRNVNISIIQNFTQFRRLRIAGSWFQRCDHWPFLGTGGRGLSLIQHCLEGLEPF